MCRVAAAHVTLGGAFHHSLGIILVSPWHARLVAASENRVYNRVITLFASAALLRCFRSISNQLAGTSFTTSMISIFVYTSQCDHFDLSHCLR